MNRLTERFIFYFPADREGNCRMIETIKKGRIMEEKDFKEEEERSIPTKEMSSGDEVSATPPEGYVYQWDYASQLAFEEGQKRRKQKRGAWVYAIVMTVAFLTCFAMLAGVLVWYQAAGRGNDGEQGFSTEQVAKIINPATVVSGKVLGAF